MADGTAIEWTDATWNPVTGCSVTSPGCTNCYAMKLAGTRLRNVASRAGLTKESKAGPVWTGEVRFNEAELLKPLRWRRPRKIFVCAHGDLFHDNVPDEWIDRVFAVMALCPQHTFQVLTKRSARMREYVISRRSLNGNIGGQAVAIALEDGRTEWGGICTTRPAEAAEVREKVIEHVYSGLPNVWLGVSVEDRERMLERGPDLATTPAAIRFWSAEPLLGYLGDIPLEIMPDQVIVGGESGLAARAMHIDSARSIRDQCAAAGVAFFFKQWGEFAPRRGPHGMEMRRVGKKSAGRLLDNVEHSEFPA